MKGSQDKKNLKKFLGFGVVSAVLSFRISGNFYVASSLRTWGNFPPFGVQEFGQFSAIPPFHRSGVLAELDPRFGTPSPNPLADMDPPPQIWTPPPPNRTESNTIINVLVEIDNTFQCVLKYVSNSKQRIADAYELANCASILFNVRRKVAFEPFPRQSNTARFSKRQTYNTNLFYYCSMPKCWDDMIECEFVISDPSTVNNR